MLSITTFCLKSNTTTGKFSRNKHYLSPAVYPAGLIFFSNLTSISLAYIKAESPVFTYFLLDITSFEKFEEKI